MRQEDSSGSVYMYMQYNCTSSLCKTTVASEWHNISSDAE